MNLSHQHRESCRTLGPKTAVRTNQNGLFRNYSWATYRRKADSLAMGLIQLGVQPGDRIAMLAENSFDWLVCDHGILSTGAATMPMHAPLSAEQIRYQLEHSESKGIFVSNQQQADKLAEVLDELPAIEFVVSFSPIRSFQNNTIQQFTFAGLQASGYRGRQKLLPEVIQREDNLNEDSLATIIYTSGTTGNPKGVMLTHGNLLSNSKSMHEMSGIDGSDVLLSWLPYSHIYARTVDHYLANVSGATLVLSASIDVLVDDLKRIHPTWFTSVPRFYEKLWASVENLESETRTAAIRNIFGERIKQLTSGGAPLPRHVCDAFFEAGYKLLEGYGLTESSPVITFNRLDSYRLGSVGQAIHEVEIRIADDGEILTRGPHVMKGYWKNDAATKETIVDDWLHTGDVGRLDDDGFLTITDRKKDLIITSGGKNVAPSIIERALISDPFIDQAVVYGDGLKFISALIVPDPDALQTFIKDKQPDLDTSKDLIECDVLHTELQAKVERLMSPFSRPEQVRRFLILSRPFALEEDELTATMKVRRRHIIDKYRTQLDALYDDPPLS